MTDTGFSLCLRAGVRATVGVEPEGRFELQTQHLTLFIIKTFFLNYWSLGEEVRREKRRDSSLPLNYHHFFSFTFTGRDKA